MWTCNLGIRNETITQYEAQSLWALHGREQWFFCYQISGFIHILYPMSNSIQGLLLKVAILIAN